MTYHLLRWKDLDRQRTLTNSEKGLMALDLKDFFLFNPLTVTICPETFSNFCVNSVNDM